MLLVHGAITWWMRCDYNWSICYCLLSIYLCPNHLVNTLLGSPPAACGFDYCWIALSQNKSHLALYQLLVVLITVGSLF